MLKINNMSIFIIILMMIFTSSLYGKGSFLKENPNLDQYLHKEPHSNFYLGVGVSGGAMKNRAFAAGSILQLHYIKGLLDAELLNISIGTSRSQEKLNTSYHVIFRFNPKFRPFKYLSFGPLIAGEFVTFPNVYKEEYSKEELFTPRQKLSTRGFIYGGTLSGLIPVSKDYLLRINLFIYKENYSVKESEYGWKYWFANEDIEDDPERELIEPALFGGFEISFLF